MTTTFTVHADQVIAPLPRIWCSTGFTPAALLLDPAMRQTLGWYGAVPNRGIRHVRIHFLMDLIGAKGLDTDQPVYDWSRLDAGIDALVDNGLCPFFELMGNPGGFFTDHARPSQAAAWRRLVADMARRFIDRYGRDEVRTWYFETWNEPNCGWWKQSEAAFDAYVDACIAGLRDADEKLQFGGPGTAYLETPVGQKGYLLRFLAHCDRQGHRLDFISTHEKGRRWTKEDIGPDTQAIINQSLETWNYIRQRHPRFAALPLSNNECDPIIGWADIHSYHARPWYAAWACRVLEMYLRQLADGHGVNLGIIGNDHGFMGTWGNRTLLTLWGDEAQRQAGQFELVKKPVYNAMVALALLGEQRCRSTCHGGSPDIGAIATRTRARARDGQAVVIALYHHRDRPDQGGFSVPVRLEISGLDRDAYMLVHYRIDDQRPHPFAAWDAASFPTQPRPELYQAMRDVAELALLEPKREVRPNGGKVELSFGLPLPALSLVMLVPRLPEGPAAVTGLRAESLAGLTPEEHVFLRWRGVPALTLASYEVQFAEPGGDFHRLNAPDTLCSAWLHTRKPLPAGGQYRVRAIDHWGQGSPWSVVRSP